MSNYTDARQVEEFETITKNWVEFMKSDHNNYSPHMHPPPSLMELYANVIDNSLSCETIDDHSISLLMNNMFMFGQYTAQRNNLYEDLIPCGCGEITDEDLKNLLGGDA